MYLINGQQPGPLVEADEGDDLEIIVHNQLTVENTVHWHGQYPSTTAVEISNLLVCNRHSKQAINHTIGLLQRGTPQMDGVPGVTQVSLKLRRITTRSLFKACYLLTRVLVPDSTRGKLHLQILRSRSVRLLLVSLSLQGLLRRCDTRAALDSCFPFAYPPLREPGQQ